MQQSPALLVVDNTLCVRLHVCMPPTVGIFIKSQNKFQWLRLIYVFTDTVASVVFFPLCLHRLKPSVPFQLLSDTNKMSVEYLLQQQTTFSLLLVCNCVLSFSSAPISWGRMSLSLFSPGIVRKVPKLAFCFCVHQCSITNTRCRQFESPGDGTVWQHSTTIVLSLPSNSQASNKNLWLYTKTFLLSALFKVYVWHFCLYLTGEIDRKHEERARGIPYSKSPPASITPEK